MNRRRVSGYIIRGGADRNDRPRHVIEIQRDDRRGVRSIRIYRRTPRRVKLINAAATRAWFPRNSR